MVGAERRPVPVGAGALDSADLVVLSHLRWDWVWQRPQHLISRLGRGRTTWFVEEPRLGSGTRSVLRTEATGPVTRVWLELPAGHPDLGYAAEELPALLEGLLAGRPRDVWLYSPPAVHVAEALAPRLLVYDVMDDLASFADAPPEMGLRVRRALAIADVALAGGRSLHRSAVAARGGTVHLFPSGVECDHYARSRQLRRPHARPTAGYVGVLDERIDLPLLAGLAELLPDWNLQLVGPVTKIDPAALPQGPGISYLGMQPYQRLPEVMAGFDVALMPFARNEATHSISPTKTLEYLAAGLPVVSTRVPDVVSDWSEVVHLADDAAGFAAACRHVLRHDRSERDARAETLRRRHEWDLIAEQIRDLLRKALAGRDSARVSA